MSVDLRSTVEQEIAVANALRVSPWRWLPTWMVAENARAYRRMPFRAVRRRLEDLVRAGLVERGIDLTPTGGPCFQWASNVPAELVDAFEERARRAGVLLEPLTEPPTHCLCGPLSGPRIDGARRCPACGKLF